MHEPAHIFNITKQLQGKPVIAWRDGQALGLVVDALVQPPGDQLNGLVYADARGAAQFLAADEFVLHDSAVIVLAEAYAWPDEDRMHQASHAGILVRRSLLGAEVLTNEGYLVGRITEAFVQTERLMMIYRVTASRWQRWRGGGLFLTGDHLRAWSVTGARLIVSAAVLETNDCASLTTAASAAQTRQSLSTR